MSESMLDSRKWGEQHISKSLKQINESTWLVGDLFILRRSLHPSEPVATWTDEDGSSFSLTPAQAPLPATTEIDSPYIKLIYECGDASAIWSIGNNGICKVRFTHPGITSESVTLRYVQEQKPTTFCIPEVFHHVHSGDRNFLFLRKLPGIQLFKLWPSLERSEQQAYCDKIVQAVQEMEQWKGSTIGGVNGQGVHDNWLLDPRAKLDFSSKNLQANCEQVGMDCSDLVFMHNDLAALNILIQDGSDSAKLNILDFELAGFLPKVWSMTKFSVCPAFNVDSPKTYADSSSYRKMMAKTLGNLGYENVAHAWLQRFRRGHGIE